MNSEDRENLTPQIRVMQVITGAMVTGVAFFALIVVAIAEPSDEERQPLISLVAVLLAVFAGIAAFVVPRLTSRRASPTPESYQTQLIVGLALLEGAAFFNLVAYLIEAQLYTLAIAGMLAFVMMLRFPTLRSVRDWIERRDREAEEREAFRR